MKRSMFLHLGNSTQDAARRRRSKTKDHGGPQIEWEPDSADINCCFELYFGICASPPHYLGFPCDAALSWPICLP